MQNTYQHIPPIILEIFGADDKSISSIAITWVSMLLKLFRFGSEDIFLIKIFIVISLFAVTVAGIRLNSMEYK